MAREIHEYAALFEPDLRGSEVRFVPYEKEADVLLERIGDATRGPYAFTEWAIGQLYTHFGVREKWFSFVSLDTKCLELNMRLARTPEHRLRPIVCGDAAVIRGFVSPQYADFPDTDVIDALVEIFHDPDHTLTLPGSTKSFQCMYAIATDLRISAVEVGGLEVRLGFSLLNSEVGYTSLRVIPVMYVRNHGAGRVIPIPSGKLYRKIHRGKIENLQNDFRSAVNSYRAYVGDFNEMVRILSKKTYAGKDAAEAELRSLMKDCNATLAFIQACASTLQSSVGPWTAMTLVDVIAQTAEALTHDPDRRFSLASIAGAVAARVVQ